MQAYRPVKNKRGGHLVENKEHEYRHEHHHLLLLRVAARRCELLLKKGRGRHDQGEDVERINRRGNHTGQQPLRLTEIGDP